MMALVDLVNDQSLDTIRVPTLVLYDPDDEVISIQAMQERLSAMPTAMIERNTVRSNAPSHHVIAGDIVAPTTPNLSPSSRTIGSCPTKRDTLSGNTPSFSSVSTGRKGLYVRTHVSPSPDY